jgi:hypothetical protein
MTEVVLRKTNIAGRPCLVSVDDEGADLLHKLKDGRDVGCEVIQRRNPRHHRLYWAAIEFISMHCPMFAGVPREKIHVALKLATGRVDTFVDASNGKVCYVPQSTSFAAMSQTEFNLFFDDAVQVISERWMPDGSTPEEVRKELIGMVDGPHALQEQRA